MQHIQVKQLPAFQTSFIHVLKKTLLRTKVNPDSRVPKLCRKKYSTINLQKTNWVTELLIGWAPGSPQ